MAAQILKYQNIVINVIGPNFPTQVFFPDQPNLRNARVVGIEVQDISILPVVSDLSTANVPQATFNNAFITLIVGDVNNITRMPLQNLQTVYHVSPVANGATRANFNPRDFIGYSIYWNKSFIEYPAAVTPVANCAFNVGVYYYDPIKNK
jgi:hypothetical protein